MAALVPAALALGIARSLSGFRVVAVVLAAATALLVLPLEAAMIGGGWHDAFDPETVGAVLFQTSVGRGWQMQAAAAVLLAATLIVPARVRLAATAAASGFGLIAVTFTGHAVMHEGWLGLAHRANDSLHLLAGGAWLGALVPLLPVLSRLDDPQWPREAGSALRRFSRAGHAAVATVIATGVLNVILVVGGWPLEWSSPYQLLLTVKIALVLIMTGLAVLNRYAVVPRLRHNHDQATRMIRAITLAEIGLGLAVIGLVSAFGLLDP